MRTLFILMIASTFLFSCDKEERREFTMIGAYDVTQVKQLTYTNGALSQEEVYNDVGVMVFRNFAGNVDDKSSSFEVTNPDITIIAFQELNNNYEFSWDVSWDDERLSLIWTNFLSTYGLTFTITENKNKKKELFFVYTDTDQDGNFIEVMEFYTLELI